MSFSHLRVTNGHLTVTPGDHLAVCAPAGCTPAYVLASKITNAEDPTWDLTPYQGPGIAEECTYWRLIETGFCLTYYYGCVDVNGELLGLPSTFTTGYSYNGYMELQIGCLYDGMIHWPNCGDTATYLCEAGRPCEDCEDPDATPKKMDVIFFGWEDYDACFGECLQDGSYYAKVFISEDLDGIAFQLEQDDLHACWWEYHEVDSGPFGWVKVWEWPENP